MPLPASYVVVYGQVPEVFKKISDGQAPEAFTHQYLKDLGYTSSNYRAFIPLLKSLGFLTAEGIPTARYHDYRNKARSRIVMAEALRETYPDLFTIKARPADADRPLIEGKFKSAHNVSDHVAKLMANSFYALLSLADLEATPAQLAQPDPPATVTPIEDKGKPTHSAALHYNIQIHLPATKDIEVYNAIFKSLKEHLLD